MCLSAVQADTTHSPQTHSQHTHQTRGCTDTHNTRATQSYGPLSAFRSAYAIGVIFGGNTPAWAVWAPGENVKLAIVVDDRQLEVDALLRARDQPDGLCRAL